MAVHIGSPKQGQWGQQGQTPNFSHTHARYNVGGKIIFPPAFPQDYVRPELLKKTHDREDNRKHRPHLGKRFTK